MTQVTPPMDPTREAGGAARIGRSELPAGMAAVRRGEAREGVDHGRRMVVEPAHDARSLAGALAVGAGRPCVCRLDRLDAPPSTVVQRIMDLGVGADVV